MEQIADSGRTADLAPIRAEVVGRDGEELSPAGNGTEALNDRCLVQAMTDPDVWAGVQLTCEALAAQSIVFANLSADKEFVRYRPVELLREIFGPTPFTTDTFRPEWRTSTALDLARCIYADQRSDLLPILADALMDAGCADDQILDHCRRKGPHVRGCWVVDWILGNK